MKTVTKLLMGAAALAASIGAAHAGVTAPSSGNSEILFFVNDETAHSTYTAEVTLPGPSNPTINGTSGYMTSADAALGSAGTTTTIYGDANFSESFAADTALTSFISAAGSDTLTFGLYSAAYSGATAPTRGATGNTLFLVSGTATNIANTSESLLVNNAPTIYNTDIGRFNLNTLDSYNGSTNGIFGTTHSALNSTSLTTEGAGFSQAGPTLDGTAFNVYGLASTGTTTGKAAAFLLGTVSFNSTSDVLSFTGETQTTSAVPLPAAAWLFGSGLLGLMGIGRRRQIAAA